MTPHGRTARIYDYLLGGHDHFPVDRETAELALAAVPTGRVSARENRAFLGRAVRYLAAEAGVRQFLDIGADLPSANNVHEVAQEADPRARVVYVDNDPAVLAHARTLLTSTPQGRTAYLEAAQVCLPRPGTGRAGAGRGARLAARERRTPAAGGRGRHPGRGGPQALTPRLGTTWLLLSWRSSSVRATTTSLVWFPARSQPGIRPARSGVPGAAGTAGRHVAAGVMGQECLPSFCLGNLRDPR